MVRLSRDGGSSLSRRRVLLGTAWATPVVLIGVGVPQAAASPTTPVDPGGSGVSNNGNDWTVDVVLDAEVDVDAVWVLIDLIIESEPQWEAPVGGSGWVLTSQVGPDGSNSPVSLRYDYPAGIPAGGTLTSSGLFDFTHEVTAVQVWGSIAGSNQLLWAYP